VRELERAVRRRAVAFCRWLGLLGLSLSEAAIRLGIARRGHAGEWACEDLEAARQEANETARPWGHCEPTPAEVWGGRKQLKSEERSAFATTVRQFQQEARPRRGFPAEEPLERASQAAVDREALGRALVAHDLLSFTSRWVAEPM
jgi:hypothetical protein